MKALGIIIIVVFAVFAILDSSTSSTKVSYSFDRTWSRIEQGTAIGRAEFLSFCTEIRGRQLRKQGLQPQLGPTMDWCADQIDSGQLTPAMVRMQL